MYYLYYNINDRAISDFKRSEPRRHNLIGYKIYWYTIVLPYQFGYITIVCEVYVMVVGAGGFGADVGFGGGMVVGGCVAEIVKTKFSWICLEVKDEKILGRKLIIQSEMMSKYLLKIFIVYIIK